MRLFRAAAVLACLALPVAAQLGEVSFVPSRTVLRLAVTGDTGDGAGRIAAAIAKLHATAPVDAILLTGDNFYPCGVASEHDPRWRINAPLTTIGVPIFAVLGNHDHCGEETDPEAQVRATGVVRNWRMPARQYAVRTGVADFVFIDTTPYVQGYESDVEQTIRGAFTTSKAPWRIVVGHHPVISSGWHGYFPRSEVRRMRALIPALRDARADAFVAGHDHHVELVLGRMIHVTSGAGSSPIPPIKLRTRTIFPDSIRRERIGFAVLEITAESFAFRAYDANGKPRSEWLRKRR